MPFLAAEKGGLLKIEISNDGRGEITALKQIILRLVVIVILGAAGLAYQFSYVQKLRRFGLNQQCAARCKVRRAKEQYNSSDEHADHDQGTN